MFGTLEWPETLVLTEDDYFDFLIGVTKNRDLMPLPVRRKLADSSLLYLGFGVDEWAFRVLFRSIMNQESDRPDDYSHVAAQIDPEGRAVEPERARRYLEAYFQKTQLSIYWGTVDAFAGRARAGVAGAPPVTALGTPPRTEPVCRAVCLQVRRASLRARP